MSFLGDLGRIANSAAEAAVAITIEKERARAGLGADRATEASEGPAELANPKTVIVEQPPNVPVQSGMNDRTMMIAGLAGVAVLVVVGAVLIAKN